MKHLGFIKTAACAALLFVALSPRTVRADGWDKKTLMTFSDTVQVPGATLPAGTYVFKLAESNADRYIVQVFNEREDHIFTTALAIPDIHLTPKDETLVIFYEAPAGQPQPVKAWFYPGDNIGREFVYKKHEAALIAAAGKETVPSEETVASAAPTPQPAPEQPAPAVATEETTTTAVAEPEPAPVTQPEEVTPQAPQPAPEPEPQAAAEPTPEPTTLPSTGSEWPLAGLIGLSSLAGALALRAVRRA